MRRFGRLAVVTVLWATGLLLLMAMPGCGGGRQSTAIPLPGERATPQPSPPLELKAALAELDALEAPRGADPAVFAELKQALKEALTASGKTRFASAAPDSTLSKVTDLTLTLAGGDATVHFSYRCQGDYDQNSLVTLSDITPIALHFGKTSASPDWAVAQAADGDANGAVTIADITPIGVNFNRAVQGYHLERGDSASGPFSQLVDIPFSASTVPAGALRRFDYAAGTLSGGWYRVTPYDGADDGIPSDPFQYSAVLNHAPQAVLNADVASGLPPLTVNFDASGSNDTDPGDTISKYEFDFGEGAGFEDMGTDATVSHVYNAIGDFTAVVRVTDSGSPPLTGTASLPIHVSTTSNQPPTAVLTADPLSGDAPLDVTFDGSTSSDPDGTIAKYEFNFDEGAGFEDNGAIAIAPHTYNTPGVYSVSLRVTDNLGGIDTDTQTILVTASSGPVIPPEWATALGNVGLTGTPGAFEIMGELPGPNQWTWTDYLDLYTMLPSYWQFWYADPESMPGFMRDKGVALAYSHSLQSLILNASAEGLPEHQITAQSHNETLDPAYPLAQAVADFVTAAGGTPDLPSYRTALSSLTLNDQVALAPVIYAASHALELRSEMFTNIGITDPATIQTIFEWSHGDPMGGMLMLNTEFYIPGVWDVTGGNYWLAGFPYESLFTGAAYVADAVDGLSSYMQSGPVFENVSLSVDTPVGRVTIAGTGDDTHARVDPDGHAILIDLGGNDTYNCHAGGTASGANGVALCLDMGGNDIYEALDDPTDVDRTAAPSNDNTSQQGAGRYGIGMLVDYGGADEYHAVRLSQGSCTFGVGILADFGNEADTYDGEALCQGGAFAGIAILVDAGGADTYTAWSKSQGFGGVMGIGYLIDQSDNIDSYMAYPSLGAADAVRPEYYYDAYASNISNCQGAGWGARWGWLSFGDPAQNEVGSGGLGIICDGGGDDEYTCGTFGQGSGFYQGTGLLIDLGGNDTHNGHWYTQGATAHVAAAGLYDGGGDDSYVNEASIGIGGAHDMSVTWFYEALGNETYNGAGLGLASGYSNGAAFFIDMGGDDSYTCQGANENTTLGKGNLGDADRPDMPSYGILLDLHGTDTYDPIYQMMTGSTGLPGNGLDGAPVSWIRTVDGAYVNGKGSGLDVF